MFWRKRGPTDLDKLIDFMRAEREASADERAAERAAGVRVQEAQIAAQHAFVESVREQASILGNYLKFFTTAPGEQQVRTMTDADEANVEARLARKRDAGAASVAAFAPVETPEQWMLGVASELSDLSRDIANRESRS